MRHSFASICAGKGIDNPELRRGSEMTRVSYSGIMQTCGPTTAKSCKRSRRQLNSGAFRHLSTDRGIRRDFECLTVGSALANCAVFLERVFHASCLRRSLRRSVFSCASFWELRRPVSLEVLVRDETFDFTSNLVGGHNLATLPVARGT